MEPDAGDADAFAAHRGDTDRCAADLGVVGTRLIDGDEPGRCHLCRAIYRPDGTLIWRDVWPHGRLRRRLRELLHVPAVLPARRRRRGLRLARKEWEAITCSGRSTDSSIASSMPTTTGCITARATSTSISSRSVIPQT